MLPSQITLDFFNDDVLSLGAAVVLAHGDNAGPPKTQKRQQQAQKLVAYFACNGLPIAEVAGTKLVRRADTLQYCENKTINRIAEHTSQVESSVNSQVESS